MADTEADLENIISHPSLYIFFFKPPNAQQLLRESGIYIG